MIRALIFATAMFGATSAMAQDISVSGAYIPLAPPGVHAHAAYLDLANAGQDMRSLIGVTATGYGMAHLHQSMEQDGVATMALVHQLDIPPGVTVTLKPGGLHIMLMRPSETQIEGATVTLTLNFANGEKMSTPAVITRRDGGS